MNTLPVFDAIRTPTLLLDEGRVRRNVARMAAKAARAGVALRPHFKTHQSAEVGGWFREAGVKAITVSSLGMARHFAGAGWDDITVAFPLNVRELDAVDALTGRVQLGVLAESVESVRRLAAGTAHPVRVWLKVDTGYGRTGLAWDDPALEAVAEVVAGAPRLALAGLLTHAGHSYGPHGRDGLLELYRASVDQLTRARRRLERAGHPGLALSVGDTPGCSVVDDFLGVDEVRPGNFAFYDVQQWRFGACREADIAVALAAPVVAAHPQRGELVVYGGAVHLSKDAVTLEDGATCFGLVALPTASGWGPAVPGARVRALSQEHGVITAPPELLGRVRVGDLVCVLPAHSCLTAQAMGGYLALDGHRIAMVGGAV